MPRRVLARRPYNAPMGGGADFGPGLFRAEGCLPAVAAKGLKGSALDFPMEPLALEEWDNLMWGVKLHHLPGLLAAAVHDGDLPTTPDQRAECLHYHSVDMQHCLELEADLLRVGDLLDGSGIRYRVLKGPAFAHLDYPDPALRSFVDIDLLVPSQSFDVAVDALIRDGYERRFSELRPGFDRRFGKGASFKGANGREIDLHRTFVMGPYGLSLDLEDVWASADRFSVAGRRFETLDADQRFLHACYHAALGNPRTRLVPLRDVAGMLQRSGRGVDIERALAFAAKWKSSAVIARAVALTWKTYALEETPLARWAGDFSLNGRDRAALRAYLDLDMGYAARSYAALQAIHGIRAKAAFAWALAFPSRDYGSGRHTGRRQRWSAATRQIIALRRRATGS